MDGEPISLISWGDSSGWSLGPVRRVRNLAGAAGALDAVAAAGSWALLWDPALGSPPVAVVAELLSGSGDAPPFEADAYHAGLLLGASGRPDDLDVLHPTWYFTIDAPGERRAVSWRLTLSALLVRTDVVAQLGGLDPSFATPEAAGLDFGWRMLRRGAIPVHEPRLAGGVPARDAFTLDLADRYLLLRRHVSPKWVRYAAARRVLRRPLLAARELAAMRGALAEAEESPSPMPPGARYERRGPVADEGIGERAEPAVSVILPTLGRYELVAQVLDDLRAQTVPPREIVCVDQTRPHDPVVFAPFADLPLTVVEQDVLGQWTARNEAIRRARHDLLLFLDDDSRVAPDFIEHHLRCLDSFGADISAGASLSVVGAPVPENYGFFRVADQFDSGNALVKRDLLVRIGAFDLQFDRMRSGDAEFGLRARLAGACSVHNPHAQRMHFKAAGGGLRTFGSWDVFRERNLFSPLPLPSVVYFSMRYFSRRQLREHLLIGLASALIPYERKRRARASDWLRGAGFALATSPLQALRVWRSIAAARRMYAAGPRIPPVEPR